MSLPCTDYGSSVRCRLWSLARSVAIKKPGMLGDFLLDNNYMMNTDSGHSVRGSSIQAHRHLLERSDRLQPLGQSHTFRKCNKCFYLSA